MADFTSFLNGTLNGSAGAAQGREGTTIQTFVISLAAGFILFAIQFGTFLIVRNYLWAKRIYQPRSFLVPMKQRMKPPHNNPFKWLVGVFKIKEDPEVLEKAGMDAYFFLRYLSMCLKIFVPLALIILPILIPVNYRHGKGTDTINGQRYNVTGLDTLAWSNVRPTNTNRYWAHLWLAVIVVGWTCFIFHQELIHYIKTRQDFLSSAAHRLKASSTTVLITDIPTALCNEDALGKMYGDFPGGIRRIWINRDLTELEEKDKLRRNFEDLLENAETDMIRKAIKRRGKPVKQQSVSKQTTSTNGVQPVESNVAESTQVSDKEVTTAEACLGDLEYDLATKAKWTEFIHAKQRPRMSIPKANHTKAAKWPIVGMFFKRKVDTIYYCRRELARLNREIELESAIPDAYPQNRSAFIQFNSQKAAHLACQSVADTAPKHMRKRLVEISPADINWTSLNHSWRNRYFRIVGFMGLFIFLIFVFGIISFFTGILSRLSTLSGSTSWLRWVGSLPSWLRSFIQGTLPPVIQVIILSGPLPILLRAMTNSTRGATTGSQGERSLQLWYFIFLLFELFIIPTISSGLTSVVQELIHQPTSVPNILATNLPTAANYYFSFLILQALSLSSSSILQTIRLFNFYVIGHVNSPDSVYEKLSWTNRTRIGSNIPWYTTFAVIGLVYSIIAPLMLIFVIITFSLFWVVIKNNLLYCVRTGDVDGAGLFFPSAINQLFTGLYFMEICLIGLFFLVRDVNDNVACDAQGIIMAFVLVFTMLYQIWLTVHLGGLFKYAPVRLDIEEPLLAGDEPRVLSAIVQEPEELSDMDRTGHVNGVLGKETMDPLREVNESPAEQEKGQGLDPRHPQERLDRAKSFERLNLLANDDQVDLPKLPNRLDPAASQDRLPRPRSQERLELTKVPSKVTHRDRRSTMASHVSARNMDAEKREDAKAAKSILARLNRPLDEERLRQLENALVEAESKAGNYLIPRRKDIEQQMMNDPISKIIQQHNDELETLDPEERDMLISVAFTHPLLRAPRPCVWIPRDELGVSDDEVRRTNEFSDAVFIENKGAFFDKKLKVRVDKPPPDMSEFALVIPEL